MRFLFVLVFLLLGLAYINIISFDIFSNEMGDNLVYGLFFNKLSDVKNLLDGYVFFVSDVNGSEPVYFFIMYFFNYLGTEFETATLLLNIAFVFVLSWLLSRRKAHITFYLLSILYLSTDYYIFVLFSETQRLKLGVMFSIPFLYYYLNNKNIRSYFSAPLMLFSHFQMGLLLFFKIRIFKSKYKFLPFLFVFPVFLFLDKILTKISLYISYDVKDLLVNVLSTSALFSIFLFSFYLMLSKKIDRDYIVFCFLCILASAIVGANRINIFVFEVSIAYAFYLVYFKFNKVKVFNVFILTLMMTVIVPYNLYKIERQYSNFMYLLSHQH